MPSSEKFQRIRKQMFTPNVTNLKLVNEMKVLNPKYAKHMLITNSLIEMMAKYNICDINLLDLPMCPKCERPMMHHDDGGYCEKHGAFKHTKTFREYLAQDICEFGFDTETLEMLESVMCDFDSVAMQDMLQSIEAMEPNNYNPDIKDDSIDYESEVK